MEPEIVSERMKREIITAYKIIEMINIRPGSSNYIDPDEMADIIKYFETPPHERKEKS